MSGEALLVVSFGTSVAQTRAVTIDAIVERLAAEFPERALYTAWTSTRIVKKVREERGELHDTLDEAFDRLTADGIDDVLVASTCLLDGGETRKIAAAVEAWVRDGRVAHLADPLLFTKEDGTALAKALCEEFDDKVGQDALLFMGHGSAHASNVEYLYVQQGFEDMGRSNYLVATLEGVPTFEVALEVLAHNGAARVHLAPLMIVAGDHALNDMTGPGDDTWQSRLQAHGYQVEPVVRGLGEYAGVRDLICAHARAALRRAGK
ncbi:MAG: sirohydrochlorin cobaltochelatase [Eggerthellaceae bacterium]|nr:sirohydrochlorin cobaltochelatase [Eggerthellaceae bacterium]